MKRLITCEKYKFILYHLGMHKACKRLVLRLLTFFKYHMCSDCIIIVAMRQLVGQGTPSYISLVSYYLGATRSIDSDTYAGGTTKLLCQHLLLQVPCRLEHLMPDLPQHMFTVHVMGGLEARSSYRYSLLNPT